MSAEFNVAACNFLLQKEHTIDELSSFSLKRGEPSKRTKVANIARGKEQRCVELIEQCAMIVNDSRFENIGVNEKQNLRENATKLYYKIEASGIDEETKRKASNMFRTINSRTSTV